MADGQRVARKLPTGEEHYCLQPYSISQLLLPGSADVLVLGDTSAQENAPGVHFLELHDFNYFVPFLLIKKPAPAALHFGLD